MSFISRYPRNRSSSLLLSSLLSFSYFTLSSLFSITYEIDVVSALSCDQLKITKVSPQPECLPTALHSGITLFFEHSRCLPASERDFHIFFLVHHFEFFLNIFRPHIFTLPNCYHIPWLNWFLTAYTRVTVVPAIYCLYRCILSERLLSLRLTVDIVLNALVSLTVLFSHLILHCTSVSKVLTSLFRNPLQSSSFH